MAEVPPLPPGPPPERPPDVVLPEIQESTSKDESAVALRDTKEVATTSSADGGEVDDEEEEEDGLSKEEKIKRIIENHAKKMKEIESLELPSLDPTDPSEMMNREAKGMSYKKQRAQAKVTKKDIKYFEKKKQERKKKQFEEWYRDDDVDAFRRNRRPY